MAYNPATFAPPLAAVVLGVAQQQAGWLGHDMIHGKGWWCRLNRRIPALLNAFDSEWWATKSRVESGRLLAGAWLGWASRA